MKQTIAPLLTFRISFERVCREFCPAEWLSTAQLWEFPRVPTAPVCIFMNDSTDRPTDRPINRSIDRSIDWSPVDQSNNQAINHVVDQSINQSVSQSNDRFEHVS